MKRRDFIALAGAAATAMTLPRFAFAQAAKVPRVAWLSISPVSHYFPDGLASLGWVNGKNITVELRQAPTNADLPDLAEQVVVGKPDVILAYGTPAVVAAAAATTAIPIVITNTGIDPVATGLASSLGHPGENVTGNILVNTDGKKLQYLKQMVPGLKRVAFMYLPEDALGPTNLAYGQAAATAAGLELVVVPFFEGQDFATQFEGVVAAGVQAALTPGGLYLVNNAGLIFDLEIKNKIVGLASASVSPGVILTTPFAGALAYGADGGAQTSRAATFVDAILKGAKPGDLPIELATTYSFAVNIDAAKKLGVTIPPAILAEATVLIDYDIRAAQAGAK